MKENKGNSRKEYKKKLYQKKKAENLKKVVDNILERAEDKLINGGKNYGNE